MSLWLLVAFVLTNMALDLGPASTVQRVIAEGMGKGLGGAQASILGVLLADFVWCFLAISVLYTVMETVPPLLYGAKWFGLVCLLVLLARALRFALIGRGIHVVEPNRRGTFVETLRAAFVLEMSRPTVMIFFLAVLSVFAGSRAGWEERLLDLGIFSVLLEWPMLTAYALCGAEAGRAMNRRGAKTAREAVSALFLLLATGLVPSPTVETR